MWLAGLELIIVLPLVLIVLWALRTGDAQPPKEADDPHHAADGEAGIQTEHGISVGLKADPQSEHRHD